MVSATHTKVGVDKSRKSVTVNTMKNEMKNETKKYGTIYDTYSGDDVFHGTLDEAKEHLALLEDLYPKSAKWGRWTIYDK